MALDRVLKGGRVVDGSGAPARAADVGIRGGRIAAVGPGLSGGDEIDC
ncbi:MAG: amidohydrolase family protein, partial [Acidobacteria bacterium]